jgi:DNA-binding LacI/PurR family transcriptional regulator
MLRNVSTIMAATIKDIAKELGISVSTVSYALNGGPRTVSEDVRLQVLEVAKRLDYRPSRLAKSMVTGKSQTLGIVLPEVGEDALLSPYIHMALNGITNEAGRLNQDLLLFSKQSPGEMTNSLVDGRIDGAIFIAPCVTANTLKQATKIGLPCVAISGSLMDGVPCLNSDNTRGMYDVLDHLYDLGHRRIAHIAGRLDQQDAWDRFYAFRQFHYDRGLPYSEDYVAKGQFMIGGGRDAFRELMQRTVRPTAIACANDEMAIGALLEAYSMGVSVPGDVSITGFDMSPKSATIYPPITTVRQPIEELGTIAVRHLLSLIAGQTVNPNTILPTALVIRESTASLQSTIGLLQ